MILLASWNDTGTLCAGAKSVGIGARLGVWSKASFQLGVVVPLSPLKLMYLKLWLFWTRYRS